MRRIAKRICVLPVVAIGGYAVLSLILRFIQLTTYTPLQVLGAASSVRDAPTPPILKLVQMNVFWRPWLLHLFSDEYIQERSRLLVDRLAEFDIICLNEAFHFGSSTVREFVEKMRSIGFDYVVCAGRPPRSYIIDNGAMILSKYPIISTAWDTYREGCSWDKFGAKGPLFARIQISGDRHVNVFSTHLQASYETVTSVDYGIRSSQAQFLRNFICRHTAEDDSPIFLLGDMNIDAIGEKEEYQNLMTNLQIGGWELIDTLKVKGHPVTVAESLTSDANETATADWAKAIDYVFLYRKGGEGFTGYDAVVDKMSITGKPYKQLSDHFAVKCTVNLT